MKLLTKTSIALTLMAGAVVFQQFAVSPLFKLSEALSGQVYQVGMSREVPTNVVDWLVLEESPKLTRKLQTRKVSFSKTPTNEKNTKKKVSNTNPIFNEKRLLENRFENITVYAAQKVKGRSKKGLNQSRESIQSPQVQKKEIRVRAKSDLQEDKKPSTQSIETPKMRELASNYASELKMRVHKIGTHHGFEVDKPQVKKTTEILKKVNIKTKLAKLKRDEQKRKARRRRLAREEVDQRKKKSKSDAVKTKQSASTGTYDPENIENFGKKKRGSPLAAAMKEVEKIKKNKNMEETSQDDNLVVFDYSKGEKNEKNSSTRSELNKLFVGDHSRSGSTGSKKEMRTSKSVDHLGQLTDVKISQNVQNAIKRVSKDKSQKVTGQVVSPIEKQMTSQQAQKEESRDGGATVSDPLGKANLVSQNRDGSQSPRQGLLKNQKDYAKMLASGVDKMKEGVDSQTRIMAYEPALGMNKNSQVRNFEFVPEYDNNKYLFDENDGVIEVAKDLNNPRSVMRGTLLKNGHIRTKAEIVLERGVGSVKIPFFKQETLYNFLDSKDLRGYGAFLLLEVDETVTSLDLDTQYESKIYLDENFDPIPEGGGHRYVLFVGVDAGNTLISYQTRSGQIADHVVHLVPDELLFISSVLLGDGEQKLTLQERNIMSREPTPLKLESSRISYFNQSHEAKREALNHYTLHRPIRPLGMRKYFEIESPVGYLIAGLAEDSQTLEIPSQKFVDQIFDQFRLDNLRGRCMIQVNFSKKVKEFKVSGETRKGPMYIDQYFLDRDGIFNREATTLAIKAFLLGDLQGVMNIQAKYEDGSEDIIQTYCSEKTYLVEHL